MDFQVGDCVQHIKTKHAWTVRRVAPLVLWDYYRGVRRDANPAHYRLLYRPIHDVNNIYSGEEHDGSKTIASQ